jgi:hypothetical protein
MTAFRQLGSDLYYTYLFKVGLFMPVPVPIPTFAPSLTNSAISPTIFLFLLSVITPWSSFLHILLLPPRSPAIQRVRATNYKLSMGIV